MAGWKTRGFRKGFRIFLSSPYQVISGMDVVELLAKVDTDSRDKPKESVTIVKCGSLDV